MANYLTPAKFRDKVFNLLIGLAKYAYQQGLDGQLEAKKFQQILNDNLASIASAPLQKSSDWGNPQRRAFFDYKGNQYTLIFVYAPHYAATNAEVVDSIFSGIYPSVSSRGNDAGPGTGAVDFDVDDLFED